MLRLAICDDLKEDRDYLLNLIKGMSLNKDLVYDFEISIFTCGEDLENHYKDGEGYFDIIFLDIYMVGNTGIKTARQVRKYDSTCKIIFITTSINHALEGYSVFAYNYLVKPINTQVFAGIFKKAVEETNKEKKKALCIKSGNKVRVILYKDIRYIESQGKTVKINTTCDAQIVCYQKLDEIESVLDDPRFLRSHKSFLVNMDYVESVKEYFFTFSDNVQVPIRQRGYSSIKKRYYDFILNKLDQTEHSQVEK